MWFYDGSNLHSLGSVSIGTEKIEAVNEALIMGSGRVQADATHALCAWDVNDGCLVMYSGTQADCLTALDIIMAEIKANKRIIYRDDLITAVDVAWGRKST